MENFAMWQFCKAVVLCFFVLVCWFGVRSFLQIKSKNKILTVVFEVMAGFYVFSFILAFIVNFW